MLISGQRSFVALLGELVDFGLQLRICPKREQALCRFRSQALTQRIDEPIEHRGWELGDHRIIIA
ncbi:MAG: hypothetical protein B7Z73_03460 [Planctomycetia bacterium 21-64-5]|nr:MAG: hypothetical protein B7Z73_03460 [Planctomycetia bacterium 21-64-5]